MKQTEHTAIVLRYANYRDNDRMLTLFSPTKGRIEALARGCRKPRSPILNASELFALGDFELYERGNHLTVISANLMETFYPCALISTAWPSERTSSASSRTSSSPASPRRKPSCSCCTRCRA